MNVFDYSRSFSTALHYTVLYFTCSLFLFFQPIEINYDVRKKHNSHGIQHTLSFFEQNRSCRSAPAPLFHHSGVLTHETSSSIKHVVLTQTTDIFLPTFSPQAKNNMLLCQQNNSIVINSETEKDTTWSSLTSSELVAFIKNTNNLLIIDCGSPLRHTERRIQDSFLLNVNDKISRKRLATRGLKQFLDANQLSRFEKSQVIVLYDDANRTPLCSHIPGQPQLSPSIKCISDEIKRFDMNKTIYVLQSSFNDFHQHHPTYCYVSVSTDDDFEVSPQSPIMEKESDIYDCQISEVLPGLFLGSSRDAENLELLKGLQIKTIINISTTLPCCFENENIFEYRRLPCHDSPGQNIVQYFETTFEYIHQQLGANRNVLLHCQAGVSRSPSFIIGYLMRCYSKTFEEAYQYVRSKRNIVSPNLNFIGQLTKYQQTLASA